MKGVKSILILIAGFLGAAMGYLRFKIIENGGDYLQQIIYKEYLWQTIAFSAVMAVAALAFVLVSKKISQGMTISPREVTTKSKWFLILASGLFALALFEVAASRYSGDFQWIMVAAFASVVVVLLCQTFVKGQAPLLFASVPIFPVIFILLDIYRGHLKSPSTFLFAAEVLCILGAMITVYLCVAANFRQIKLWKILSAGAITVFFLGVSFVSDIFAQNIMDYVQIFKGYHYAYFAGVLVYAGAYINTAVQGRVAMMDDTRVTYYGWSAFTIESEKQVMGFDPYFSKNSGVQYFEQGGFPKLDIVLLTHNHPEHSNDIMAFVERDQPTIIAPSDYFNGKEGIGVKTYTPVPPKNFSCGGFEVKPFLWQHRTLESMIKDTAEQDYNHKELPECFGYTVVTQGGKCVVNIGEGVNPKADAKFYKSVRKKSGCIDLLLMACQLDFTEDAVQCVKALKPEFVAIYHPHKALFEAQGIKSKSLEEFKAAIEKAFPKIKVCIFEPGENIIV